MAGGHAHKAGSVYFEFFAKTSGIQTSLGQIKADFNTLKRSAQVLSGVLALAFKSALKSQGEFHATLRRLKVILDASKDDIAALSAEARKWARTSGYSADEVLKAFLRVGQAGVTARKDVENLTRAAVFLGHAAQISAEEAAEDLTGIMLGYKLQSSEMQQVVDDLATVVSATKVELGDLLQGIKFAGPWAREAGLTVQELSVQLGLLGNNMLRAGLAGRNWRAMIISLMVPTKQTGAILKKYGLDFTEVADAPSKLIEKLTELKEVATTEEFGKVFTRIASNAAMILSQNLPEYDALMAKVREGRKTAQELTQEALQVTKGQWAILKNAIEEVGISFLEKFNPAIEGALTNLRSYASAIGEVIQKHPDIIVDLGKFALATMGLTVGLAILNPLLAAFRLAVLGVYAVAHLMTKAAELILAGVWIILKNVAKFTLFSLAIAPVTTTIVLLAGALGLLAYFNWDSIVDGFTKISRAVNKVDRDFGHFILDLKDFAHAQLLMTLPATPERVAEVEGITARAGARDQQRRENEVALQEEYDFADAIARHERVIKEAEAGSIDRLKEFALGFFDKLKGYADPVIDAAGGDYKALLDKLPKVWREMFEEYEEARKKALAEIKGGFKPTEEEPLPELPLEPLVKPIITWLDKLKAAGKALAKSFIGEEGGKKAIEKGFLQALQGAGVPLSLEDFANQLASETETLQNFGENVRRVIKGLAILIDSLVMGITAILTFGRTGGAGGKVVSGAVGGALAGAGGGFFLSGGNPLGAGLGALAGAALGAAGAIAGLADSTEELAEAERAAAHELELRNILIAQEEADAAKRRTRVENAWAEVGTGFSDMISSVTQPFSRESLVNASLAGPTTIPVPKRSTKFLRNVDLLIESLNPSQLASLRSQFEENLAAYNFELAQAAIGNSRITEEMRTVLEDRIEMLEAALDKFITTFEEAVENARSALTELFDILVQAVVSPVPGHFEAGNIAGFISDLGEASEETRSNLLSLAQSQLSDYTTFRDLEAVGYDVSAYSLEELNRVVQVLTGTVTDLEGAMGLAIKAILDKTGAQAIEEFTERWFGPEADFGRGMDMTILGGVANLDKILNTKEMKEYNQQIQDQLRDMQITRALLPANATLEQRAALDQQIERYEALVEQLDELGYTIEETDEKLGDLNVPSGYKVNLARWLAIVGEESDNLAASMDGTADDTDDAGTASQAAATASNTLYIALEGLSGLIGTITQPVLAGFYYRMDDLLGLIGGTSGVNMRLYEFTGTVKDASSSLMDFILELFYTKEALKGLRQVVPGRPATSPTP